MDSKFRGPPLLQGLAQHRSIGIFQMKASDRIAYISGDDNGLIKGILNPRPHLLTVLLQVCRLPVSWFANMASNPLIVELC